MLVARPAGLKNACTRTTQHYQISKRTSTISRRSYASEVSKEASTYKPLVHVIKPYKSEQKLKKEERLRRDVEFRKEFRSFLLEREKYNTDQQLFEKEVLNEERQRREAILLERKNENIRKHKERLDIIRATRAHRQSESYTRWLGYQNMKKAARMEFLQAMYEDLPKWMAHPNELSFQRYQFAEEFQVPPKLQKWMDSGIHPIYRSHYRR